MRHERTMYRLLVLDLDGTLLTSRRELSARTIEAVNRACLIGTKVVLASGRPVRSLASFSKSLELCDPLVALNGALTYDPYRAEVRRAHVIDPNLADNIVAMLRTRRLNVTIETDRGWYVDRLERSLIEAIERGSLVPPSDVGDVCAIIDDGVPVYKIISSTADADRDDGRELLDEWLIRTCSPHLSLSISPTGFVEMVAPGVSKESAVSQLALDWGIDAAETIAVGDESNDVGMIGWAGLGIAMGNALPSVKGVAQFVAGSNDEDGVAAVIERFILR